VSVTSFWQAAPAEAYHNSALRFFSALFATSMRLPSYTLRYFRSVKPLSLRRLLCIQSTGYRPLLCFSMPPKQQATLGYVETLQTPSDPQMLHVLLIAVK
jgi:hypothetical protein